MYILRGVRVTSHEMHNFAHKEYERMPQKHILGLAPLKPKSGKKLNAIFAFWLMSQF